MPTEQQMIDLQTQLNQSADLVQSQATLAAALQTQILQKQESLENLKGGLMNTILNERFEINNKLKHTNDTTRRIRFNELAATDAAYQAALAEVYALEEQKSLALAEAEYQRKLYRSTELLMLHYANNSA
jgi:hypothetical protein